MTNLHVYYDYNSEWIVAESPEEAIKLWRDAIGYNDKEIPDDELDFIQEPDDKKLGITIEDPKAFLGLSDKEANDLKNMGKGYNYPVKTCGEWAKATGKGLLCSSEY